MTDGSRFDPFRALTQAGLCDTVQDYSGPFADLYDSLGGSYEDDIPYYLKQFPGGQSLLELGAGTGRLTVPLADAGNTVTALEPSEDMLTILKTKCAGQKRVKPELGSTSTMGYQEQFDAVIAPFNMIYHLHRPEERVELFQKSYAALKSGGKFFLHYFFPDESAGASERGRFLTLTKPDPADSRQVHMICNYMSFDPANRHNTVDSVHFAMSPDKTFEAFHQTFVEYHMPIPELKELMGAAGFQIVGLYGNFSETPLREVREREFVLAVGRKP